jgi:TRAP transporter 4TM/12TM fusion protein
MSTPDKEVGGIDASIDRNAFTLPRKEDLSTELQSVWWVLTAVLSIALAVLVVHHAYFRTYPRGAHTILAVGLAIAVSGSVYLLEKERFDRLVDKIDALLTVLAIGAVLVITVYLFTIRGELTGRIFRYTTTEYILAAIMVGVVVAWVKRAAGTVFFLVVVALLIYGYTGPYFPGALQHRGMSVTRLLDRSVLLIDEGIFGSISRVGATWIAVFVIYAGLMQGYGAMDLFTSYAVKYASRIKSGIPQSAVLTSFAVGSILGAGSANTAITGSFTIPLMQTVGIKGKVAAAIESVGSSGGQIMPPVMGTSAFIIASFLGIDYVDILIASFLPAVLFFSILSFTVYLVWAKSGLEEGVAEKTDRIDTEFEITHMDAIPFLLSFVILLYYLVWLEFPVLSSAIRAIGVLVGGQFLFHALYYEDRAAKLKDNVRRTLEGLQIGGVNTALILVIIAAIEVMVIIVNFSGITQELSFFILDIGGESLFLILLAGAVLSLVFGLGMPVVAAYVLVAIFVAPMLTQFGIPRLHTHLFVLYFAVLSSITPPVAVCCVVASAIADSDFIETSLEAVKMASPLYILPFSFVSYSSLLHPQLRSISAFLMVAIGLMAISIAAYGYLDRGINVPARLLFLGLGFLIIANFNLYVSATLVLAVLIVVILSMTRIGTWLSVRHLTHR